MQRRLVRLRARPETLHVSQSRAVLITGADGWITEPKSHGLFYYQTRILSRYRYLINGQSPQPNALSNVEQHTWLGYYICLPPEGERTSRIGNLGQMEEVALQTLELRVSRYVGPGMHEDLDLHNYSRAPTRFRLEMEVDADFADQAEFGGERIQRGPCPR